jgi:hypothetical protein
MKYLLVPLVILLSLTGCGVNSSNPASPNLTPTAVPSTPRTYDMLAWMTIRSDLGVNHHMAGTGNPLYTSVQSDRFYWTKMAGGYPWDI